MRAHSRHDHDGHARPVYFISSRPEAYEVAGEVDLERARELAHTIAERAARRYPTVEFRIDDQWHLHDEQLTGVANYIESHWERWTRTPRHHH